MRLCPASKRSTKPAPIATFGSLQNSRVESEATVERHLRKTLDQIRRDVRDHQLWLPGSHLLIGCSGGHDSMALWALLNALAPSLGHETTIGHVDHGLQPGEAPESVIRTRATQTQQPVEVVHLSLMPGADMQARARVARYDALHSMAERVGAQLIVTAHHADDQAETVLMRACRGAGAGALSGIRWHRDDGVVRPLLGISRSALHEAAATLDVSWWEDPSNATDAYQRNRMRHEVLPALECVAPGAAQGLSRTAANAAGHAEAMAHWVRAAIAPVAQRDGSTLQVPRALVPTDTALLAPLVSWICGEFATNAPSRAAVRQLVQTLRAAESRSGGDRSTNRLVAHCKLHGLDVQIGTNWVTFGPLTRHRSERPDVACPPGAD